MLITREASNANLIRACERGRVQVNEQWFTGNLVVTADAIVSDWTVAALPRVTLEDLGPVLALGPELVILGSGHAPAPPDVELMAALAAHSIGLECMATPAACRTFNVLVHEGRRVAAALIVDA
jgi:uncharacterized protein